MSEGQTPIQEAAGPAFVAALLIGAGIGAIVGVSAGPVVGVGAFLVVAGLGFAAAIAATVLGGR